MSAQARVGRRRGELGVTSTELAVLMPVLILLTLLPIQVGLWWHAKQAADLAAQEAIEAAQLATATSADGQVGAAAILDHAGNLEDVRVTVTRTADTVTVDVTGRLAFSV